MSRGDGLKGRVWAALVAFLIAFSAFCGAASAAAPTPTFTSGVAGGTGADPYAIASGDFDGDGNTDLATANQVANTVSLLLGDGAGGFTSKVSAGSTGRGPTAIVARDFDGDGKLDLATADNHGNGVSILRGDGAGGFTTVDVAAPGSSPWAMTTGDFDGDGKVDLAATDSGNERVLLFIGDGSGGFADPVDAGATGQGPRSITAGDFDSDGDRDLAVANAQGDFVSVFTNDGSGSFSIDGFETGIQPASIARGDFDNDGRTDLATANAGSKNLSVLIGDGTGKFASTAVGTTGDLPQSITAADFNRDGIADLATSNSDSDFVSIFTGDGTGGFASTTSGSAATSILAFDLDGDAKPDLATNGGGEDSVSVMANTSPALLAPTRLAFGSKGSPVAVDSVSKPQTVIVTGGGATAEIYGTEFTGADQDDFFVGSDNCRRSLAVGQTCKLTVRFAPTEAGTRTASLRIESGAFDRVITLKGTSTGRKGNGGNRRATIHLRSMIDLGKTARLGSVRCPAGTCTLATPARVSARGLTFRVVAPKRFESTRRAVIRLITSRPVRKRLAGQQVAIRIRIVATSASGNRTASNRWTVVRLQR